MAVVEENWQSKCSAVADRTSFIFNTELLSDVKFVVPTSSDESAESKKVIPAHKFVLAISSPVFYAMFYGQMAETKDSIELPDCEYESLLEMFRYLYSDKVNLSGRNVMHVLYLANKYLVSSLAEKCTEYLRNHLKASNVFCILPHAQKFVDKDLQDRCWKLIEEQTGEAVTSDEFVTIKRSLVETVVKREVLNVKEVELKMNDLTHKHNVINTLFICSSTRTSSSLSFLFNKSSLEPSPTLNNYATRLLQNEHKISVRNILPADAGSASLHVACQQSSIEFN